MYVTSCSIDGKLEMIACFESFFVSQFSYSFATKHGKLVYVEEFFTNLLWKQLTFKETMKVFYLFKECIHAKTSVFLNFS